MRIQKRSPRTGNINEMDIPVTESQLARWKAGTVIQVAMPNLTPDQREFLMTGYTPEDWKAMFGPDEDGVEPDINDVLP